MWNDQGVASYQIPEMDQMLQVGMFRVAVECEDMRRRLEQFKLTVEAQPGGPSKATN